jgi:hypothetical protein
VRAWLQVLLALAVCGAEANVSAAAQQVRASKTLRDVFGWQVIDSPAMLPEPVWVDEFHSFVTVEMVPLEHWRAVRPVLDAAGKEIVPAGTSLIGLVGDVKGACTNNPQGPVRHTLLVNVIQASNVCLIDTDKDGRFDQYFAWAGRSIGSIPIPKLRNTLTPASLEAADPRAFPDKLPLYLQYDYFASFVDNLSFGLCLSKDVGRSATMSGAGYYVGCVGREFSVHRSRLPEAFEALGGKFMVKQKDGKRLLIEQVSPIVPQPVLIL